MGNRPPCASPGKLPSRGLVRGEEPKYPPGLRRGRSPPAPRRRRSPRHESALAALAAGHPSCLPSSPVWRGCSATRCCGDARRGRGSRRDLARGQLARKRRRDARTDPDRAQASGRRQAPGTSSPGVRPRSRASSTSSATSTKRSASSASAGSSASRRPTPRPDRHRLAARPDRRRRRPDRTPARRPPATSRR